MRRNPRMTGKTTNAPRCRLESPLDFCKPRSRCVIQSAPRFRRSGKFLRQSTHRPGGKVPVLIARLPTLTKRSEVSPFPWPAVGRDCSSTSSMCPLPLFHRIWLKRQGSFTHRRVRHVAVGWILEGVYSSHWWQTCDSRLTTWLRSSLSRVLETSFYCP